MPCRYCGTPATQDHESCTAEASRRTNAGLCITCGGGPAGKEDMCGSCWQKGQNNPVRYRGYPGGS